MFIHQEDYSLGVYPMKKEDVIEIDNFSELASIDPSYREYRSIENEQ